MSDIKSFISAVVARLSDRSTKRWTIAIAVVIFIGYGISTCVHRVIQSNRLSVSQQGAMGLTPVQIERIKSIGQWEFLAISDEELVDTVRHGFFGDDELSRIYYGTLRLGIDLREVSDDWIKMNGDTVEVTLPPIRLLDKNFIDEARTKAFYEEGKWSERDKAQLTLRAAKAMEARCMTATNVRSAAQNASAQFSAMLRSMGYEYSKIRFNP